jgi:hypothetical protein
LVSIWSKLLNITCKIKPDWHIWLIFVILLDLGIFWKVTNHYFKLNRC